MISGLASEEGNTSFGGVNQSENGNNLRRKRKGKRVVCVNLSCVVMWE